MTMRILAASAALVLAPCVAQAATITSLSAMVPLAGGTFSQNIAFAQFDPTAGTLTGVTVILYTRYAAKVSGTFPFGAPGLYSVGYSGLVDLSGANGGISLYQTFGDSRQVFGCGFACVVNSPPTGPTGSLSVSGADVLQTSQELGGDDDLTPFIGGGLFNVTFSGFSTYDFSENVDINLDLDSLVAVGGRVRVTYTFDSPAPTVSGVPEPATWSLMILGFGLIGATMRTRRRIVRA